MRTLRIADYITKNKQYLTTYEELCDHMTEGDEGRYASEIMPSMRRDAFERIMYHGTGKPTEILHSIEYSRFNEAVQYLKQLLIHELEKSKKLMSIVQSAVEIYRTPEHTMNHMLARAKENQSCYC